MSILYTFLKVCLFFLKINEVVAMMDSTEDTISRTMNAQWVQPYRVNTSNSLKLKEFQRLLGSVVAETQDLKEPQADLETVVIYKASQFQGVLVDDTALEIEGESVGVQVKWLLKTLDRYAGKKATFIVMLGIRWADQVMLYRGAVPGTMVHPRGQNYGFLSYFQPEGSEKTLGECLAEQECVPDLYNPRFYAIQDFLEGRPYTNRLYAPLEDWSGSFQGS